MPESRQFTRTELLATSVGLLIEGGYREVDQPVVARFGLSDGRVFEDGYGVAAVFVFDAWNDLSATWPDLQGGLVDLISKHVGTTEAKAWEGYLVLLSAAAGDEESQQEATAIRYNMNRLRKLVGFGSELESLGDIERVLRPLLPLRPQEFEESATSTLGLLPELLESQELPRAAIVAAITAYTEGKPIVEALRAWEATE